MTLNRSLKNSGPVLTFANLQYSIIRILFNMMTIERNSAQQEENETPSGSGSTCNCCTIIILMSFELLTLLILILTSLFSGFLYVGFPISLNAVIIGATTAQGFFALICLSVATYGIQEKNSCCLLKLYAALTLLRGLFIPALEVQLIKYSTSRLLSRAVARKGGGETLS